jgi:hypothetical protein
VLPGVAATSVAVAGWRIAPVPDATEIVQLLRQRGAAGDAADHHLVALFFDVYRQVAAETPQWLGLLHAAAREGLVELSPAALGALKSLALAGSGAGEGAWRRLHPSGDAALIGLRLLPAFGNLLVVLKIQAALPPASAPDQRLIDALCDDDQYALRCLPAPTAAMPSSVIAAAVRALRRQPADFSDADVTLRAQLRQVFDWALAERADAGVFAVRCGWNRLADMARDWLERRPGLGAPSALPLRLRARHLEAVQLRTPTELERESLLMDNCLDNAEHAQAVYRIDRAYFSIRDRATRRTVADLSLAYWPRSRRWAIEELQGYANQDPQPDVRAFARALCASVSPRLTLRFPKALPDDVARWAHGHPDPRAARLAARFALVLARRDGSWLVPFITRSSRYRGALGVDTTGDSLLAAWQKEFARARRPAGMAAHGLRLLRLPSDAQNQPHCLFDLGDGPRAIGFRADGDGRLGAAFEQFDRACLARWLGDRMRRAEPELWPAAEEAARPISGDVATLD